MWSNFHTHSKYCDGKGELTDYISKAKELHALSLGFSSHAPLPFTNKWCMKPEQLNEYLSEVNSLKQHSAVEVYSGLEVDFIPGIISPADFKDKLDYTIGSIHFVDSLPDGTPWEIDGTQAFFQEGFERIFDHNIQDTLDRYFELTRDMVMASEPTVVGHLDKIKIQNIDDALFCETDTWYQQMVKKTVDEIARTGSIIEVNTRGIYQKKSATPYPSPWVLEYIHQKKIPVTLNSDAHHPDDIVNQFTETASLLKKIGFKTLSLLHEGQWKALPFTEHGIVTR
ncbi:MAG TPA: histidinol-phosphatase [Ohtaekwangia sp.]